MKKILHIAPTLGGGGAEILLGHIVLEQIKRGDIVEVVLVNDLHFTYSNYPFKDEFEKKVKVHFIKLESIFSFKNFRLVLKGYDVFEKLIENFKPDVIHSHLFQAEIFSHYKIFPGVKYISHLHDNMHQFSFSKSKKLKENVIHFLEVSFLKKQYRLSNSKFISISKDTTAYFTNKLPSSLKNNIHELSNATNLAIYYCDEKKINIKEELRLVSVGNLVPKKAHEFLIDVVERLIYKNKINVKLDVLGFGPKFEEYTHMIYTKKLENHIILHGNVKDVELFLSKSHIFVHSAKYEPFGMVFLEAMASSLPIVSLDGRGNKGLIINDYNGFFIEHRDLSEFTDAVVKIYENDELRTRLAINSKQMSLEYSIVRYIEKLNEIYSLN